MCRKISINHLINLAFLLALLFVFTGFGKNQFRRTLHAQETKQDADYATAIRVLENKLDYLDKRYNETNDPNYLWQKRTIIDAIRILATGVEDKSKSEEMERAMQALPRTGVVAAAVGISNETPGCVSGLVAELITLDEDARSSFVEQTGLEIDVNALNTADYLVFDMTDGPKAPDFVSEFNVIEADCPDGPGVKGMILSYYLMDKNQRGSWMYSVPTDIKDQINTWLPTDQHIPSSRYEGFNPYPLPNTYQGPALGKLWYWKYQQLE